MRKIYQREISKNKAAVIYQEEIAVSKIYLNEEKAKILIFCGVKESIWKIALNFNKKSIRNTK